MESGKSGLGFQSSFVPTLSLLRVLFQIAVFLWLLPAVAVMLKAQEGTPQATTSPIPEPSPAAPENPVETPILVYKFVPGTIATYKLAYESAAHADFRALFQDQKGQVPAQSSSLVYALSAQLHGQWSATIVDADSDRVRVFYQLRDTMVHVIVNDVEQSSQGEGVRNALSHGVLVDMSPDGRVLAIYLDSKAEKFSRDFAQSIFGISEFVLPGESETGSWESHEEDRTGAYLARYQPQASSAQTNGSATGPAARMVIRKTKLRYAQEKTESTLPGQTPAQKTVVPKGYLQARFDPEIGQLVSLSGTESQDTIITEKNVAHSAITLSMTRVGSKELAADELAVVQKQAKALADNGSRIALYTKASPQAIQSSIQRTQLGSETLDSLLQQLHSVEALKEKSNQTDLYLKFKALVYVHPESCKRLGAILATADSQSPTFVIIARALGSVNNAQAQDALVAAIKARPGELVAIGNLIPTLAQAPFPTPDSEETIRDLSNTSSDSNISATALLSLGTMAHGLARKSRSRSSRIVNDLIRQTMLPQKEDRTHDLIEALGNTQSASALQALAGFAKKPEPRLRAAAMDALRFMPAPKADTLLLNGLGDSDGGPRLEAAYALGFRTMTVESFTMQKKAVLADNDEKVRAALLTNLWKAHRKFPEARALVQSAADKDPSEYVRKLAKGMLLESP